MPPVRRPGINPREIVRGLAAPSLLNLMVAGVAEIKERGIVVPKNLGAFVVEEAEAADVSPDASSPSDTSSAQEEPLVNPLLKPGTLKPSVFGDGRVVVIHAN